MAKRAGNINYEQKTILFEFVKNNPKVVEGKFSKDFTFKDSQNKWKEISNILNLVPNGGSKHWRQWRKVWQDMKTKAKNNKALLDKISAETEGNALLAFVSQTPVAPVLPVQPITNIEETSVPLFADPLEEQSSNELPLPPLVNIAQPTIEYIELESVFEAEDIKVEQPSEKERDPTETQVPNDAQKYEQEQRALTAATNMEYLFKRKLEMKEKYYKRKLALMEEDIKTKKEIAKHLKLLTYKFIT